MLKNEIYDVIIMKRSTLMGSKSMGFVNGLHKDEHISLCVPNNWVLTADKNALEPTGAFATQSCKFLLVLGLVYCCCSGLGAR